MYVCTVCIKVGLISYTSVLLNKDICGQNIILSIAIYVQDQNWFNSWPTATNSRCDIVQCIIYECNERACVRIVHAPLSHHIPPTHSSTTLAANQRSPSCYIGRIRAEYEWKPTVQHVFRCFPTMSAPECKLKTKSTTVDWLTNLQRQTGNPPYIPNRILLYGQ